MTAQEAIDYIENYSWSTTRLGLERTRALLHSLGDPQKKLKFIHVAGSNGKGSTCAMLDSILRQAGYRTGLYTSPYIQDFCERIQLNGQNISGKDLARITEQVRNIADTMEDHPSQFELVTAIAMQYYSEQQCDIVVLEVGMGGELDSTNVIDCPEVAVITNIGLEHTEYLGDTLTLIAQAKGGIIKHGCEVVCYDSEPETMQTLQKISLARNATCHISRASDLELLSYDLNGQRFLWKGHEYSLSLLGAHQLRNAAVVLETVDILQEHGWSIPESSVGKGFLEVRWPARFELLRREPLFILDGGHNPQCAQALVRNLEDYLPGQQFTFLVGVLADKDYRQMLQLVAPFAKDFICVTPDSPRALSARELAEIISEMGFPATACETIEAGVLLALDTESPVMSFGSLYLAGRVRTVFPGLMKKHQRKTALLRRDSIPAEKRVSDSRTVCEKILDLDAYRKANTIFLFRAFRSELDLSFFADQAERDGKILLYPYCIDRTHMLAVQPGDGWETDRFGISVPVLEQSTIWDPVNIDLILCPCSAFDAEGRRLGMGAGYYDRFLPQCKNAYKILTAFEAQQLKRIFTESFDVPMDAIITEERTIFYG